MDLKKTALLALSIGLTLVLGACASSYNAVQEIKHTEVPKEVVKEEVKDVANNENLKELYDEVNKAKEEISKDNKLTDKEMLKIGKKLYSDFVENLYNVKNDEDVKILLKDYFLEDNQVRKDTYLKLYKEETEKYNKGEIEVKNESVEHYGKTEFVYRATVTESNTLRNGQGIDKTTYNLTMNIEIDKDGKYKIFATSVE